MANTPASTVPAYLPITSYTSIGQKYEDAFANVPGQIRAVDWAISYLLSQPHNSVGGRNKAHVVDLACGTGRPVCARLAAAGRETNVFDVLGVDLTPAMVEVARKEVSKVYSNARFEVGDIRTWSPSPPRDATNGEEPILLDGVFTFFGLLAGVTQAEIRGFFSRAIRWVRPGGVLVFGTVPLDIEDEQIRFLGQDFIVSSLLGRECKREIEKAGWRIEGLEREMFRHKGVEVGLCTPEEAEPEEHLFICCTKP